MSLTLLSHDFYKSDLDEYGEKHENKKAKTSIEQGVTMPDFQKLEQALPVAPLGIIAMKSAEQLGSIVNDHLVEFRSK